MRIFKKCNELVKEITIKYDPNIIIPDGDSLADEFFEAGLRLAVDFGAHSLDTKIVIKFTEILLENEVTVGNLLTLLENKNGERLTNLVRISEDKLREEAIILINGTNVNCIDRLDMKLSGDVETQIIVMNILGGG